MSPAAPLSLADWAALPLHRVAASAAVSGTGALSPVGGIEAKAAAAARNPVLCALGVCTTQCWDGYSTTHPAGQPLGDRTEGGLSILKAASVGELAQAIAGRLGDETYGPVVALPQVLTLADTNKRFDYRASSFHPFEWLDALVGEALRAPHTPGLAGPVTQDPPLGEVRKLLPKGYLHVLGTAGSGKTSWALNWVRRSQGAGLVGVLPRLAGWYFARRFGASGVGQDNEQDEVAALQNLVSLARRQRDVLPARPMLLNAEEAGAYRRQPHQQRSADSEEERNLRERFCEALKELAVAHGPHGTPSAESPMVFLIDGGDEMWSASARHTRWTFPRILPTLEQLPDHVYIVLLSRPGAHMLGFNSREPLLRYQFAREQVDAAIRGYLTQQAHALQALYPGNEASLLLLDTTLQGHIARASDGAFGYVPLLMWQWHADRALDGRIELQAQRLRQWLHHPGSLPDGVYGLRAREFLDMQEKVETKDRNARSLAQALALLTQLRWPLTQRELIALLYPGDAATPPSWRGYNYAHLDRLEDLLQQGASWLSGVEQTDVPLQFGHRSLAEVAQAAWRLSCNHLPLTEETLLAEARELAAANAGDDLFSRPWTLEGTALCNTPLSEYQRQQADAWLHAELAASIEQLAHPPRWVSQQELKPDKPWLQIQPVSFDQAYGLVWGPLHALTAAACLPPVTRAGPVRQLGERARRLLIDASYLQTAIEMQAGYAVQEGAQANVQALRETYIMADRLPGEDPDRRLRHRVESAVLDWYLYIASGAAQVGGVLWNLLGGDPLGQVHAEAWKASLVRPALITERPGRPLAFSRIIQSKMSALTECGDWLVTSDGDTYTEVWDLRRGRHRAVVHVRVDWAVPSGLRVCTDGSVIAIGGSQPGKKKPLLFLGWIGLWDNGAYLASYAGHRGGITSIAVRAVMMAQDQVTHLALASGSVDNTVGLLLRSPQEVLSDAARSSAHPESPNPGVLARYAGHSNRVISVALRAVTTEQGQLTHWALASGSNDNTVGLLVRSHQDVPGDAAQSLANPESPNHGVLTRYAGHRRSVRSIALHAVTTAKGEVTHLGLASGSGDGTIGLLLRSPHQVLGDAARSWADPASPNPGVLARYVGHRSSVGSIALHAVTTAQGQVTHWALASGSQDNTVGLLVRSPQDVPGDAAQSLANPESPNPGVLARFAGHSDSVCSVALRPVTTAQGQLTHWALASGSQDETVGLLVRSPKEVLSDATRSPYFWSPTIEDGVKRMRSSNEEPTPWESPNLGVMARYTGHRGGLEHIALNAITTAQGQLMHLALASANWGEVGLLVRSPQEVLSDAARFSPQPVPPGFGLLARYAGHKNFVNSIALHTATTAQGQLTHWALASGSSDRTVGLLVRSPQEVLSDAARSSEHPESRNAGVLARYTGPEAVRSIALQAVTTAQAQVTHWALACGYDGGGKVGLLVRSPQDLPEDILRSWSIPEPTPIQVEGFGTVTVRCELPRYPNDDLTLVYTVHSPSRVESITLRTVTTAQGQVTHWALASGSDDRTVSLLLRSHEEVLFDAARSRSDMPVEALEAGLVACYPGLEGSVNSIALHAVTAAQGQLTHWALASGSNCPAFGLLVRSPQEVLSDAARSSTSRGSRTPGALACFAGHGGQMRSIALRAVTTAQNQTTHWALAFASSETTVDLVTIPHEEFLLRAGESVPEGIIARQSTGRLGTKQPVHLTDAAPPRRNGAAMPASRDETALHWFGGDSGAAFIWKSTPQTGLEVQFVCPYNAEGFIAKTFAQALDGVHYMVGGVVGHDVALLPLRMFDPDCPESA